jgi:hypothetical protein
MEHDLLCDAVRRIARGEVSLDPGHARLVRLRDSPA